MSCVLRGIAPAACKEAALDVLPYASPQTAGQAGENPCLSRHSPFSGDGGCGLAHRKKYLIYELETT